MHDVSPKEWGLKPPVDYIKIATNASDTDIKPMNPNIKTIRAKKTLSIRLDITASSNYRHGIASV